VKRTASVRVATAKQSSKPACRSQSPIASALQPFVEAGTLAGAVALVADEKKILSIDTVGCADRKARKPMRSDTLFWIASQSKPVTATAFMMLIDAGKVALDDPVERYLPEFKELKVAVERDADHVLLRRSDHPITIRDILSHSSGMPFCSPIERPTLDGLPLRVAVASYAATPLDCQPGTKYQYSNAGINTAARIIEVITGEAFEDFLDRRLFAPLGMRDTTFFPSARQIARLAKTYRPTPDKTAMVETTIDQLHYPLNDACRYPMPAGGLFATAADVAKFCQMILRGGTTGGRRYLSRAAVAEMTRRQTPATLAESYGLGWGVQGQPAGQINNPAAEQLSGTTFGHGGALSTNMTIDPQHGLITVYLVQHAGFPAGGEGAHAAFVAAARKTFGRE
jgi:CubicO group peptidase (beta-lactamase class C family)